MANILERKSPHKVHLITLSCSRVFKGSWVCFYLILFGTSVDGGLQTSDLLNSRHISSLKKDAVTKMDFFVFSTKGGEVKQKKKI